LQQRQSYRDSLGLTTPEVSTSWTSSAAAWHRPECTADRRRPGPQDPASVDEAVARPRHCRVHTAPSTEQSTEAGRARQKRLGSRPADHQTPRQDRLGVADGQGEGRLSQGATSQAGGAVTRKLCSLRSDLNEQAELELSLRNPHQRSVSLSLSVSRVSWPEA
jgi:hypothetical protein